MSAGGACRSRTFDSAENVSSLAPVAGVRPSPESPRFGLPIASPPPTWQPPALIAGDVEQLRRTVAGRRVEVQSPLLGAATEPTSPSSVLVRGLGAEFVAAGAGPIRAAVRAGSIALERLSRPGPPRYRFSDEILAPTWDEGIGGDAELVAFVDAAPIEREAWQALPARMRGTCEPAMATLAAGQEQSLAMLEPFLDHTDAVLAALYRIEASRTLPELREALAEFRAPKPAAGADPLRHGCGHFYWSVVEAARCESASSCPAAPRVILDGRAQIGWRAPAQPPTDRCEQRVGRDVLAELASVHQRTVTAAADRLDPRWSELADRLAALVAVHDALVDACTPRRRRFAPDDIDRIRRRVASITRVLAEDPRAASVGAWRLDPLPVKVPGVGPVRRVATFDAGPGGAPDRVRGEAAGLRELVLERARCTATVGDTPWVVAVADVATKRVVHLGFYFPEELSCEELGPRSDDSPPGSGGS